ncbi:hypothetical protein [Aureibacter tunicatorum]|uniref:DNA-binding CsgD family transcriptional regulator n=1 Tax=Aureibacter tunicatorum TaxID=866807 RepID=A0AAE3XQ39_9BACT|nr:hypothetical protein [Aureibacter tunicatorum]MDR6239985.1 DNA-binding CsgD family transcriptional regulator [Aureibacter tunicatorum]BDD04457.1 hypothetical protein AUTU_19400 [Aureibacter tunicatorum]
MTFITRKELAVKYDIHPQTLANYLKRIGIMHKFRLSPKEVKQFEEHYDY